MKPRTRLSNMEIDEISLVDKGANQHAMITIAKRATEEEEMPELYDEDGKLLDEEALEDGQIVYTDDGTAYQFTLEDEEVEAEKPELEPVGKSAFLEKKANNEKTFSEQIMEELSKSYSDDDRDKVISKALGRVEELEKRYKDAEEIAKSERDIRLTREYISKAADYNLPVAPEDLGPVLYRMAETMSYEDCSVIAKCLESAGEMLFQEVGYQGGGDNNDIMDQVNARAVEIGKAAGNAVDVEAVFDEAPEAYDQYLAQRGLS